MAPNPTDLVDRTHDQPAATSTAVVAESGHPRRWSILVVLAAVAFMAQLDLFIVNIALPSMSSSFGRSSLSSLSWVLNAYAIVFAALLVPAGRLADHFGRRRFLLVGVAVFTVSSVLCAVAPGLGILIVGRVVQAVGAAMIVPASLGLLMPVFPKAQHTLVVGIWAGVAAVAASSGPVVGGLLVSVNWRLIFLVNVPIGIATIIGGLRVLPEIRAERGARLPDATSIVSVLAAVTLLVLATVEGPQWGWDSAAVLGLFTGSVLAIALTVRRTLTSPRALIEARLFESRQFTGATIALFLFFISFAAWLLITVLFLQDAWHYSALKAGLAIAPGPLTAAFFAVNSGRIGARFGRTIPAAAGALSVALAGVFWILFATQDSSYWTRFLPGLILGGMGAGLAQAPLFASASTLPADRATTGSAMLNMARQVGSAFGVALLVALLASPDPHVLASFQRGWVLVSGAALAAGAVVVGMGPRPHARRSARSGGPRGDRLVRSGHS
jgi:EmrB/QacA subfamily drug resistance transporter